MRYFLFSFLLSIVSIVSLAQTTKQAKKNNVKSVVETKIDYSSGVEEKEVVSEKRFDKNGEVVELKEYKDGKIDLHEKYAYDTRGNKIKQVEYDAKGKVLKIIEYKYSGKLRTERIIYYPNGKVKSKKVYKYEFYEED